MRTLVHLAFVSALVASGDAHAMRYGLTAFQNGSTAIVAEGRIQRDEAPRLLAFLQAAGIGSLPRTLVISSPGGELVGAVLLGQTLRQLGIRTVVGSIAAAANGQASLGAGRCHSACVFVLMGGTTRSVVPGSLVGVHSPQPVIVVGGRAYVPDRAATRYLVQRTGPALRLYARQMGVSSSLIDVANGVPHTSVRNLSSSELARYSLVTQRRNPRAFTKHQASRQQRSRR
jgi:hypothetical protein